jgi:RNA polymerase sigma-70 factor (ECF subfamily)
MAEHQAKHNQFVQMVEKNHPILQRIVGYYTNERHEQEDLYQEIVYQLWRSFDSFAGRSSLSTWLYRIAANTSISYLRKKSNQPEHHYWESEARDLPSISYEDPVVANEQKQLLYHHIRKLDDLDQTLILLYLEELEYQTISEITGLSVNNVGVRLHRIKKQLKSMITQSLERHGS